MRTTWGAIAQQASAGGPVAWFLRRYFPWFNAYAFVMSRRQEYEADAIAVRACGAAAGRALVRLNSCAGASEFWSELLRTHRQPEPPAGVLALWQEDLQRIPAERATRALAAAWRRRADRVDTHPALAERLRAMGQAPLGDRPPPVPAATSRTAARALLGAEERSLAEGLSARWRIDAAPGWRTAQQQLDEQAQTRDQLRAKPVESLDADALVRLAQAELALDGPAAALPWLDRAAAMPRPPPLALFLRGQIRLERDDPHGLLDLNAAIAGDRDATAAACNLAANWLRDQGRPADAMTWELRAEGHGDEDAAAARERAKIPAAKLMRPPTLPAAERERLRALLAGRTDVAEAFLVRVETRYRTDQPWHLLLVRQRVRWWSVQTEERIRRWLAELAAQLPEQDQAGLITLVDYAHHRRHLKAARRISDARLL
jgi:hypothetical protein